MLPGGSLAGSLGVLLSSEKHSRVLGTRAVLTLSSADSGLVFGIGLAEALGGSSIGGVGTKGVNVARELLSVSLLRSSAEHNEIIERSNSLTGVGSLLEAKVNGTSTLANLVLL